MSYGLLALLFIIGTTQYNVTMSACASLPNRFLLASSIGVLLQIHNSLVVRNMFIVSILNVLMENLCLLP